MNAVVAVRFDLTVLRKQHIEMRKTRSGLPHGTREWVHLDLF